MIIFLWFSFLLFNNIHSSTISWLYADSSSYSDYMHHLYSLISSNTLHLLLLTSLLPSSFWFGLVTHLGESRLHVCGATHWILGLTNDYTTEDNDALLHIHQQSIVLQRGTWSINPFHHPWLNIERQRTIAAVS